LNPRAAEADQWANSIAVIPMTEDEGTIARTIAEASELPLKDAAYLLWRECSRLDLLAWRSMPSAVRAMFRSGPPTESSVDIRYEHDHAEDGLTFDRLQLTHPGMDDTEVKQAIIAAVKFDDACFGYFEKIKGEFGARFKRAVELAARDHPGYLELTYQRARYYVSYYMK
jgi:hypothetical protein